VKTVDQARADLDYIRQTLEQAGTFTAISGTGVALAGAVGLLATALTFYELRGAAHVWTPDTFRLFLLIWGIAAAVAMTIAGVSLYLKGRRWGMPLHRGPSRRALRCMAPGWIAATLLTLALVRQQAFALVPSSWLFMDGLALLGAATFSIPPVRYMGWLLLAMGVAAAFIPSPWPQVALLGAGFGLLHLIAGIHIERSHRG
jgi:hypothetical protein